MERREFLQMVAAGGPALAMAGQSCCARRLGGAIIPRASPALVHWNNIRRQCKKPQRTQNSPR